MKSYLNVAGESNVSRKLNFCFVEPQVDLDEGIDVVIPLSSVQEVASKYSYTLYGYFIGKRIAFPVVQNYILNVWKKYGLEKIMMNSKGFFFFKFSYEEGMLRVLQEGPWMIRTIPIILNKWSPNISLTKEDLMKVPVWARLYDVPLVGFTDDGLSVIASKIIRPMMLDAYTSTMCKESWGRPNFARAMIEVSAETDLKESLKVATPSIDGDGVTMDEVRIEYDWKPPRCSCCKVFGHMDLHCPKVVCVEAVKDKQSDKNSKKDADGFKVVLKNKRKGVAAMNHNKGNKGGFGVGPRDGTSKDKQVKVNNSFGALVDEPSDVESDKDETATFMAEKHAHKVTAPFGMKSGWL
ncbi:uncharacterized protein [Rutidosis leptorrhynchoides]|uniref:uncharacterized protein n=1 Tax=Rutidosis leptorrhynchoides TaxID=125765 RepID=UPI003A996E25